MLYMAIGIKVEEAECMEIDARIEYVPERFLVETKSLKLYLWKYRNEPGFNEAMVDKVASDLHAQIKPLWLRVTGQFNPRGGIRVEATAERGDIRYRPS